MISVLIRPIDSFLNQITMYRLVLYVLIFFWICAFSLSFLKFFPFSILEFGISTAIILTVCYLTNKFFSLVFKIPTNLESVYITALILSLIITPAKDFTDFIFLSLASFLAMASKYGLAINRKHIFNPAGVAVFLTSIFSIGYASWWVGNVWMLIPVVFGGFLIIKKIQRFIMMASFMTVFLLGTLTFSFINGSDIFGTIRAILVDSPILFFASVMLVEPLTSPGRVKMQMMYGGLVGILSGWQFSIGPFYSTYETALIFGNLFSYIVSPKYKLEFILKDKVKLASDVYEFIFNSNKKINFFPGQYLEWTLKLKNPDNRGNRRYFTIASSPTENDLRIGVKFYENGSSFKNKLLNLSDNDRVYAGQLSGDFVLPQNKNQKFVFVAGGIGITPFRSILKYLLDTNIKMPAILFYSNKNIQDIVYKDILDEAEKKLEIKTVYCLTDSDNIPKDWTGERGRVNEDMIKKHILDFKERIFYLSGPHAMVVGFEEVLKKLDVRPQNIKKDFFPGYV